jgi:DNA-directed RNA polymerase subunit M/transcription elongation factor TFIIS
VRAGRVMQEPTPTLTTVCRVCGHNEFRYVGLYWLRIATILKLGGTPHLVDPEQPDQAAVKFYVCTRCRNGFIDV